MRIAKLLSPLLSLLVACLASPVTGNPYETNSAVSPYAPVTSPYGVYTPNAHPQVIDQAGIIAPTPVYLAGTDKPPTSSVGSQTAQPAQSYYDFYQSGTAVPQVHSGQAVGCTDYGCDFNGSVNGGYDVNGSATVADTNAYGSYGCADCDSGSGAGCSTCGAGFLGSGLLSHLGNGGWHRGWYGSFGGLYMSRDRPNRLVLTTDAATETLNLMDNRNADTDWEGGFEVTFGHCISDRVRWEVGFWYLSSLQGFSSVLAPGAPGQLRTPLNLDGVTLGGDQLAVFFDDSSGHEVYREDNFHNLELNFYYRLCCRSAGNCYGSSCGGCGGGYAGNYAGVNGAYGAGCHAAPQRWNVELLGGVRYFNFDENFIFAGVQGGSDFGDWGGADEAYIISDVQNQLVGFQLGTLVEYNLSCNWTLYARPKVGIYGNRSRVDFNVVRGNGADTGWNATLNQDYPVRGKKNDVALLAELDLGVRWNFGCHWSAYAGYRVIGASGVALSDNQIPFYLADLYGVRDVDTNGSLILHGATFGLGFQY